MAGVYDMVTAQKSKAVFKRRLCCVLRSSHACLSFLLWSENTYDSVNRHLEVCGLLGIGPMSTVRIGNQKLDLIFLLKCSVIPPKSSDIFEIKI